MTSLFYLGIDIILTSGLLHFHVTLSDYFVELVAFYKTKRQPDSIDKVKWQTNLFSNFVFIDVIRIQGNKDSRWYSESPSLKRADYVIRQLRQKSLNDHNKNATWFNVMYTCRNKIELKYLCLKGRLHPYPPQMLINAPLSQNVRYRPEIVTVCLGKSLDTIDLDSSPYYWSK